METQFSKIFFQIMRKLQLGSENGRCKIFWMGFWALGQRFNSLPPTSSFSSNWLLHFFLLFSTVYFKTRMGNGKDLLDMILRFNSFPPNFSSVPTSPTHGKKVKMWHIQVIFLLLLKSLQYWHLWLGWAICSPFIQQSVWNSCRSGFPYSCMFSVRRSNLKGNMEKCC